MKTKRMTYQQLMRGFRGKGYELEVYGNVLEKHKKLPTYPHSKMYTLHKIVINPQFEKTLLITSGFHGEEFNGPISLLEIFDEVVAFARKMQVRLIVYPCINPSGFDLHKRYNASNEKFNNDFLRYEIEKDRWVGTLLKTNEGFIGYKIVDSPAKEVRLLKDDVLKYPVPHGVLDIHQDRLKTGNFYAYILNQRPTYLKIMKKLEKITDVAKNVPAMNSEDGRKVYYKIDEDGFIMIHDGTITDMFYWNGSKFIVCAETNTKLALEKVCQINLIWIKEMIKLIAKK